MRKMTESEHQQALIQWARMQSGKYPELRFLYAIPNGARVRPHQARKLVGEGLKAGVSDLHLPVPRGHYHGLWIEMKSKVGRLSELQQAWLDDMMLLGHDAVVMRDWREAAQYLEDYLSEATQKEKSERYNRGGGVSTLKT